MFKRSVSVAGVIAVVSFSLGCRSTQRTESQMQNTGSSTPAVHYVEIVSDDVDALTTQYQSSLGVTFGAPDADLGQARVATLPDGSLLGIRKPLAAHETPILRTYFATEDIASAVKKAEARGAMVAYGPTKQGARGTFAIVIQGGVQLGFWQR